jgi:hypothetical protein
VYSFCFKAVVIVSVLIMFMLNALTQGLLGQMFFPLLGQGDQILHEQPQATCATVGMVLWVPICSDSWIAKLDFCLLDD